MANNFRGFGDTLDLAAPYDRLSGQGAQVGQIFGVAEIDVLNTVVGPFKTQGVWELTKIGSQAWTVGALVYWDNTNKRCTTSATGNLLIGCAVVAVDSAAGSVLGKVRLNAIAALNS